MELVTFTGMPGAGKTHAASYVARTHGLPLVSASGAIRAYFRSRGVRADDRATLVQSVQAFCRQDAAFPVDLVLWYMTGLQGFVVVEAFRSPEQLMRFQDLGIACHSIWIEVDFERRLERLRSRGRDADERRLTARKLKDMQDWSTERRIPELQPLASESILNDGDQNRFHEHIDRAMQRLGLTGP